MAYGDPKTFETTTLYDRDYKLRVSSYIWGAYETPETKSPKQLSADKPRSPLV